MMTAYEKYLTEILLNFVNTVDSFKEQQDALATPDDLAYFLEENNLPAGGEVTEDDVRDVIALRERLRQAFTAPAAESMALASELLAQGVVTLGVGAAANEAACITFNVTGGNLASRLGVLAGAGLIFAHREYGAERLKICAAAPCVEVFIDQSKNKSRRFCGDTCANRHNVAQYRERQKESAEARH